MAWIVGFVNREAPAKTFSINSSVVADYNMSDYRFKKYFLQDANSETIIDGYVYVTNTQHSASPTAYKFVLDQYANQTYLGNSTSKGDYKYTDQNGTLKAYIQDNGLNLALNISTKHSLYDGISSDSNYNSLLYEEGKIIRDGTDFYKIGTKIETHERTYRITEDKDGTYLLTYLTNFMKSFSGYKSGTPYFEIYIKYDSLRLTKIPIVEGEYTINYPGKTEHLVNKSAPFDIFCIPFADDMKIRVGAIEVQANKQFAMSIASEIGRNLAGDCYDIQLLPFCPMTGYTVTDNIFDINSGDAKRRTAIMRGDTTVYWMFWSTSNSGTFNIRLPILAGDKKIANQCDMYRLVSPNYSGQFEFNLAKNGGYVEYFNVDYTYLPISSYIHVNPDFKGLYGSDFNDARGLICQGDFSIMYLSDPWVNYQQNNKNFEQIFSREISNMDVNRKYQRIGETISAWTGALGAAGISAGLSQGTNIGGPIAGFAAGAASLAAGYADRSISDKLYQESVSFKKDMHEMQLENIKALPNSIAKTTAYNENNKIFPVLEYYTCTDEEKDLVANAIVNMGMTVNAVGKPIDYIYNTWSYNGIFSKGFFKATLIRLEDLPEDYHMLQAIAEELSLGIYFKGE